MTMDNNREVSEAESLLQAVRLLSLNGQIGLEAGVCQKLPFICEKNDSLLLVSMIDHLRLGIARPSFY